MEKKSSEIIGESYDQIAGKYVSEVYAEDPGHNARAEFIQMLSDGARILDVGCGGGQDSAGFEAAGFEVVGIDPSERMVELSSALVPSGKFLRGGLLELDLEAESFDGIWCNRVFQHIPIAEQDQFVKRLNELLKFDGVLYFSARLNDKAENQESWESEKGGPEILVKLLSTELWPSILSDNGFSVKSTGEWSVDAWVEAYAVKID